MTSSNAAKAVLLPQRLKTSWPSISPKMCQESIASESTSLCRRSSARCARPSNQTFSSFVMARYERSSISRWILATNVPPSRRRSQQQAGTSKLCAETKSHSGKQSEQQVAFESPCLLLPMQLTFSSSLLRRTRLDPPTRRLKRPQDGCPCLLFILSYEGYTLTTMGFPKPS